MAHGTRRRAHGKRILRHGHGTQRRENTDLKGGARTGINQFGQHGGYAFTFFLDKMEFVFDYIIDFACNYALGQEFGNRPLGNSKESNCLLVAAIFVSLGNVGRS